MAFSGAFVKPFRPAFDAGLAAAGNGLLTGGLSSLDWDVKVFRTGGWSKVVTSGNAQIAWTPTRAV